MIPIVTFSHDTVLFQRGTRETSLTISNHSPDKTILFKIKTIRQSICGFKPVIALIQSDNEININFAIKKQQIVPQNIKSLNYEEKILVETFIMPGQTVAEGKADLEKIWKSQKEKVSSKMISYILSTRVESIFEHIKHETSKLNELSATSTTISYRNQTNKSLPEQANIKLERDQQLSKQFQFLKGEEEVLLKQRNELLEKKEENCQAFSVPQILIRKQRIMQLCVL